MVVPIARIHELYRAEHCQLQAAGRPVDHATILQGLRTAVHLELREQHAFDGASSTWEQAGIDIKEAGRWRDPALPPPPRAMTVPPAAPAPFRCPTVLSGLAIPDDFPAVAFEGAYQQALPEVVRVEQFVGAWRGMAYRFKACTENAEMFARLVAQHGSNTSAEGRFAQDREMFEFHVNGYSALECLFYGIHFTAELIDPAHFDVTNLRRITPGNTVDLFTKHFAGEAITSALTETFHSEDWNDWGELRNLLAHRITSGRIVQLSTRPAPAVADQWLSARAAPAPRALPNIVVVPRTLPPLAITEDGLIPRRRWLANRYEIILSAAHPFIAEHL